MLIEMTAEEQALWDELCKFWGSESGQTGVDHEKWRAEGIGKKQRELTVSLLGRKAIPAHRFDWLTDPEYVVGLKKSRMQILRENSRLDGDRIYEIPSWYTSGHLPFLVGVIKLPDRVVRQFRENSEGMRKNGYEMGMEYRAVAKSAGLTRRDAEEFHKLALDCGYEAGACRTIRDIIHGYLKK